MATTLDTTRLIQQNLFGKNQKPKPDRYNIYQLLRHTDGRYGVVTRSGIFDGDTPKLSLISGKFHDDEKTARAAYQALITKMKESRGATDGSYKFNAAADEEWQALTNSVEKRQRALEERRARKAREQPKEEVVEEEVEVVEEEDKKVEVEVEVVKEAQVEVAPVMEDGKIVKTVNIQRSELAIGGIMAQVIKIENPNLYKEEPAEQAEQAEPAEPKEEKPKRKGGRKAVVPPHFEVGDEDREQHWQEMNQKSRRAWKRENPVEE